VEHFFSFKKIIVHNLAFGFFLVLIIEFFGNKCHLVKNSKLCQVALECEETLE
jgi:hypothetical protein